MKPVVNDFLRINLTVYLQTPTGALALDYDARMQVRQLVAETFERIVIYHCGIMPETGNPHIDLVLMAKGGTPRMLRIDRKSGAWMAQEYGAG